MSHDSSYKISRDFNEEKWIAQVRQNIEEDVEEDDDSAQHVCIFKVPKILLSESPDLYVPQKISIGPYHYLRDELYGMEKIKLYAAKGTRKKLQCSKFEHLVDQLVNLEMRIRACYNNFLDFKSETLTWMMAIDACFMIEFMDAIIDHRQKRKDKSHLLEYGGYKVSHNIILQDLVMLENQIPLFILRKVLESQHPLDNVEERLVFMINNICKELSPFCLTHNYLSTLSEFHLLDFLYQVIIVAVEDNCEMLQIQEDDEFAEVPKTDEDLIQHTNTICTSKVITVIHDFFRTLARKVMVSRLVKCLTVLSWKMVSSLPPISMVKQPIEYYFYVVDNEGTNQPCQDETSNINKPSLIEEIEIPSVKDLVANGIKFSPTSRGISTISFDTETKIIYLPQVHMETHTEVVLKNLISYEALVILGPMTLARYTELMNGIIDTDEDVRLLKESNIIVNHLKSDCEVTNMWNGMRKSIKPTKVPMLDRMIDDINEYYDTRWQVKAKQLLNRYVFDPWKFFICLGIVFFFLLVMIQTLISIYRFVRF